MSQAEHGFVTHDGRVMYRVSEVDGLAPFLMTVVSPTDHWLFLSSTGGLTAGRVDADHALFPYETEDRLHRAAGRVGPVTLLAWRDEDGRRHLWAPFAPPPEGDGARRALFKTVLGDRVAFETVDEARGLTCAYVWTTSDRFGFVREVRLTRHTGRPPLELELLDGLLGILPAGIDSAVQERMSVLGDAYKQAEVDTQTGLAVYSLTSHIVDRPEPAESLRATVAWQRGLVDATIALDERAVRHFRRGERVQPDGVVRGRPGAFLASALLSLSEGQEVAWVSVADVGRSQADVVALLDLLASERDPRGRVRRDVEAGVVALGRTVARADGVQVSNDHMVAAHHRANVLFNVMRGGVFADQRISRGDLVAFLGERNPAARDRFLASIAEELPALIAPRRLRRVVADSGDADLIRLCAEYLPLTFSRRHGDPSRPWNRFSIRVRQEDGQQRLDYEGNWRDIFQNWEALCHSFPDYLESVVAVFVNASTVDGFNPYRITRAGVDWEVPEAGNPWSNIGYWGDHQIIYLLKLLEASRHHHPKQLVAWLSQPLFTYADVPYRLRPYADIVRDPHSTLVFDWDRHADVLSRVEREGADGRMLHGEDGELVRVTLAEKLLVPALSKLSNLVLGAGIWMNTQRPEWNDANNALVGHGVSAVTQAYLFRYMTFLGGLLADMGAATVALSAEVARWLDTVHAALQRHAEAVEHGAVDDERRRRLLDELGEAFGTYRAHVYRDGFSGTETRPVSAIRAFVDMATRFLEYGVQAGRRDDGLYHAYNLLDLSEPGRARIRRLPLMLEGQVAVLSTETLSADETTALLDALFSSSLYWPEQRSFLLYPRRELPGFLAKNQVPDSLLDPLLQQLLERAPGRIVERDARGVCRFASRLRNARDLADALDDLASDAYWAPLVDAHRATTLLAWETVFHHHAFTGRSGTMVGYEGIGCIYWHMVSKLLLAVQERFLAAREAGDVQGQRALAARYRAVRRGLSFEKSVDEYGAVPIDPYSHTPPDGGARQPGMTGQVKEEILTRRGELGLLVRDGRLHFDPALLQRGELLPEPRAWTVTDAVGVSRTLTLPANGLGFTVCQVPVTYVVGEWPPAIQTTWSDGSVHESEGLVLDIHTSTAVFERRGKVAAVEVRVPSAFLLD